MEDTKDSGGVAESAGTPPVLRATDGVKFLIRKNGWGTGRRLPSEDSLALHLGVSRSTIRKALNTLEKENWVHRERNRGCVVARAIAAPMSFASRTLVVFNDMLPLQAREKRDDRSDTGITHGMVHAADALKFNTLFASLDASPEEAAAQFLETGTPGLVMLCWQDAGQAARRAASLFHKSGLPVVAFGMDGCPEAVKNYDRVASDHESGMVQLLELLAARNCRRILRLWVPSPKTPWIVDHERAYARVRPRLGLQPADPVFISAMPARVQGDAAVFEMRTRVMAGHIAEHIRKHNAPHAIMVGTDCETFLAAAACRTLGLKPGEDVLITGYDNYWHSAFERQFEPSVPFATVDKRNATIGAELIHLLATRLSGAAPEKPRLSKIEQVTVKTSF